MTIRLATAADAEAIWQIFKAVVAGGDTYVFAPDTPRQGALDYFLGANVHSWVAEEDGVVVGMYKLIPNRRDLGSHVANASFMVAPSAHGRGIGRAMGEHCLNEARRAGYQAMQFNFVVSTNKGAVHLAETGVHDSRDAAKGVQSLHARLRRRVRDASIPLSRLRRACDAASLAKTRAEA